MPSCEPVPPADCLPAKTFRSYFPRCHRTYSCVHCRAHLAKHDELISKGWWRKNWVLSQSEGSKQWL
uniref:Uncharacterized protein n=1 Tax=Sphenodon punctatus TaxID=8508 RepID=A0A8D0LB32_SPHPU